MAQKNILVQGAARGLGLAIVERVLAHTDDRVLATARDLKNANRLRTLSERFGPERLAVLRLDIGDEASILSARQRIGQRVERLDCMLICAGVLHDDHGLWPEKRLADVVPDNLATSFAVNAIGPLLMIKHCHDLLIHGERAVIASLSARVASIGDNRRGGWYAYRASKAAQNQFTRTAAIELRRQSKALICVGLHPGTVDTGLSKPFQKWVPKKQLQSPDGAAAHLLDVLDGLTAGDSGGVFDWAGQPIEP